MAKTIHIKVTDEMYYDLVSVKAKHHLDTWIQLFEYIIKHEYKEQPEQPVQTANPYPKQPNGAKQSNQTKQPEQPICQCGHPESCHAEDGCLGDGGLCECKQIFNQTA